MREWKRVACVLASLLALGACTTAGGPIPRAEPRVAPPVGAPPQGAHTRPSPGAGQQPPMAPPPASGGDTCGAQAYRHLIGRPLPQPFTAAGPVRIYTTGQPVTMDHNPSRLNIELAPGQGRRVVAVHCG